jgi:hypothetical protein
MVSKIKTLLITLFASSLIAHENFNQITANVNSSLGSSYLKLEHESHFYAPNGDILLLHLAHSPHVKFFKNEVGLGYRTFFHRFGVGANLYYMNMTKPSFFIHQFSPGLEFFYKNLQVSYNAYLPTSIKKSFKNGDLYHSTVSEFGLNYNIVKGLNIGILPFFDHDKQAWGLNSKISYTMNKFEFSISPYLKKSGNGCLFSFGFNFGAMKTRASQPIQRANDFSYVIHKKQPKIYVVAIRPGPIPEPVRMPIIPPIVLPPIEDEVEVEEVIEEVIEIKPEPKKPSSWWDSIPFFNYKGIGIAEASLPEPIRMSEALSESSSFEMIASPSNESSFSDWEHILPSPSGTNSLSSSGSLDEFYKVPFPSPVFYDPKTWTYEAPDQQVSQSFNSGNQLHIWEDYIDAKETLNL